MALELFGILLHQVFAFFVYKLLVLLLHLAADAIVVVLKVLLDSFPLLLFVRLDFLVLALEFV